MTINKLGFMFEINSRRGDFRMSLIKINKKTAFIFFLLSFGVGKNPCEDSGNEYYYFYFDYPRKYDPNRESWGFRIRKK